MNKTEIIGNLVRDCERRVTQTGLDVGSFTVAVRGKKKEDETIYYKVTVWRKLAEICAEYAKKGVKVYVCGTMDKPKPYTANNGEVRCDLCLTANDVEFLNRPYNNNNESHMENKQQDSMPTNENVQQNIPEGFTGIELDDDSLPF